MSPWYFIAVAILILLSGFFSGAEMAFSSANSVRLENIGEDGNKAALLACNIIERYDEMLSTILICNNLVNISVSAITSVIAIQLATDKNVGTMTTISTIVITLLIIIFGETIPKIIAKKNANRMAMHYAYIIRVLSLILKPIVILVVAIVKLITIPMKGEKNDDEQDEAVEELVSIIETVEDEGVINEERSELMQAALDFYDTSASEVMTSRVDMVAIDIEDDWEDILETIKTSPYSRLPVYEDSIDNVIGVLYLNHFFKAITGEEEFDILPLLIRPCFVYKTVKLPSVMAEMRKNKTHIAIVTDEYGGSMGVVTMEDVLEELVGEIYDETDEIEPDVIEHDENLYELDGDMNMSDLLEMIDMREDSIETDSATVGGWTIENFGRFPQPGDSFDYQNFNITVLEISGQRVEKVLLCVNDNRNRKEIND